MVVINKQPNEALMRNDDTSSFLLLGHVKCPNLKTAGQGHRLNQIIEFDDQLLLVCEAVNVIVVDKLVNVHGDLSPTNKAEIVSY